MALARLSCLHGNLICAYTLPEYISDVYVDGLCLVANDHQ